MVVAGNSRDTRARRKVMLRVASRARTAHTINNGLLVEHAIANHPTLPCPICDRVGSHVPGCLGVLDKTLTGGAL